MTRTPILVHCGALAILVAACSTDPGVKTLDPGTGGAGTGGSGKGNGPGLGLGDGGLAPGGGGGGPIPGVPQYAGGVTRPCTGLECQQTSCKMGDCKQKTCPAGQRTTLSGKVFDPAGRVPIYNVIVYVPNAPLAPIATGPSCDRCASPISGKPIAAALTDTKGEFVLDNVPVGKDVPLVLQIGKWRRELKLPSIDACTDNRTADPGMLRLPRNQSEGNIPKIALATGNADKLECLLRKIGIDDAEFTPEGGTGRINLYGGHGGTSLYDGALNGGARFTPAPTFWNAAGNLNKYDMVILSCEGKQYLDEKSPTARQWLSDYANAGGRVFASHWHNGWLESGPQPWPQTATFVDRPDLPIPFVADIDTSFPKGQALAEWLVNVQASTMPGKLSINEAQHTVQAVNPVFSRRWIYSNATNPTSVQYFTFNTPPGTQADMEPCGRVVFTDIHVSAGDQANVAFPRGCRTKELSPQEKALEFMLFDLSSCVMPDDLKPRVPDVE